MLYRFLQSLHDSGRAELAPVGRDLAACVGAAGGDREERRKIERMLGVWHSDAVMELPGPPLEFHPEAAMWGATLLFRAACLLCFREIGEHEIRALLQQPQMPDVASPAAHFSADLCLRHWPELCRMARAQSEDDLLVKVMYELAAHFPLSSLGMNLPTLPSFRHAGLRQFHAERALERSDHASLAIPEIGALVRSKLGHYATRPGGGSLTLPLES